MQPSTSQISCPNCRNPVSVALKQVFDLAQDQNAKQLLLSGGVNFVNCPHCGYQGNLATPVVYHDPAKELLLVHVPAEMGLSREDQERSIGRLINRVIDSLPQEQRKGYLLSPQTVLTMQGLVERVLEEDGITKEMIEDQQKRLNLVQRLLNASKEVRSEIAQQEDDLLDAQFFVLLGRLSEASAMNGDAAAAEQLRTLQDELLPLTSFGQEIQSQTQEMEAAIESIQTLGEGLTREKLLDLVIEAPNPTRLRALAGLARQGMDYTFFQILSDRIEHADGDEQERLTDLRQQLLEITGEIDQQVEARLGQARQLLKALLQSEDIKAATLQNLPAIDEFFVQVLNAELAEAQDQGDRERLRKLQGVVDALQEASQQPPELEFIQALMDAPDPESARELLDANADAITPNLVEAVMALLNQAQTRGDQMLTERLRAIHRMVVRASMKANLEG